MHHLWQSALPMRGSAKRESFENASLRRFDRRVARRNGLRLASTLLSALLTVIWLQTWDDSDPRKAVGTISVAQNVRTTLQIALTLLSFLQIAQVADYYLLEARHRGRAWFITDSQTWLDYRTAFLIAEVVLALLHPVPGLDQWLAEALALASAFRFHIVFRVLRDLSRPFRFRAVLLRDATLKRSGPSGGVQFSWDFVVRVHFKHNPWTVVSLLVLVSLTLFSYAMYVFERSVSEWTLRMAFWSVVVTMTTVGYGDAIAYSTWGRILAGFAAMIGIILASILVTVVLHTLTPSPVEKRADLLLDALVTDRRLHVAAARLVQHHWRWHRATRQATEYRHAVPSFETARFQLRSIALRGAFRRLRRHTFALPKLDGLAMNGVRCAKPAEEREKGKEKGKGKGKGNEDEASLREQVADLRRVLLRLEARLARDDDARWDSFDSARRSSSSSSSLSSSSEWDRASSST